MNIKYDLKWAQTLDGQLCDDTNTSQWISSKQERIETHKIRKDYDGVLVGGSTFVNDLAKLTVRYGEFTGANKQPIRIILDPRGRVEKSLKEKFERNDLKLLAELKENSLRDTLLLSPKTNFFNSIGLFVKGGLNHVEFDADFKDPFFFEKLDQAIAQFYPEVIDILVEGGPRVITQFLKANHFEKAIVSVASKITGGEKNRISLNRVLSTADEFNIRDIKLVDSDMMLFLSKNKSPMAMADRV